MGTIEVELLPLPWQSVSSSMFVAAGATQRLLPLSLFRGVGSGSERFAGRKFTYRTTGRRTSRVAAFASLAQDRIAVVTGAGSGVGRALCIALVARGLRVVGVGRRRDALAETRALLAKDPSLSSRPSMDVVVADISSKEGRDAVASHVRTSVQDGSKLTCLVHNAAAIGELGPTSRVTLAGFQSTMATNVEGPLFLTQCLAGSLADAPGGGRVLHMSSGAAHGVLPGSLTYCTSKAALLHLMRCLDAELAPQIRVGSAMPGVVDTPMQETIRSSSTPSVEYFRSLKAKMQTAQWKQACKPPPGALDNPENVADFLTWLLLDVKHEDFGGREWDINDPSCQQEWLSARRA